MALTQDLEINSKKTPIIFQIHYQRDDIRKLKVIRGHPEEKIDFEIFKIFYFTVNRILKIIVNKL